MEATLEIKKTGAREAQFSVDGVSYTALRHTPGGEAGYSVWGFRRTADGPMAKPVATHMGDVEHAVSDFIRHTLGKS